MCKAVLLSIKALLSAGASNARAIASPLQSQRQSNRDGTIESQAQKTPGSWGGEIGTIAAARVTPVGTPGESFVAVSMFAWWLHAHPRTPGNWSVS